MSARARSEFKRYFGAVRYSAQLGLHHVIGMVFRHRWALPRPAYCDCCRAWAWCTDELAAYSTSHGFLCEECAEANDKETEHAWRGFI